MNNFTKKLTETFNPFAALVAYKSSADNSFYLEYRGIKDGKLQAGRPIRETDIAKLLDNVRRFNKQLANGLHGKVPSNVLYCDTDVDSVKLIWYRPSEVRQLFFIPDLAIPNGRMKVPGLVYSVKGSSLSVFAFKGKAPVNVLYRAPFMNVYDDGKICLGNAKVKKPEERTFENVMKYWEDMFWLSEFSHIIGANPSKGNLATITKDCIENDKRFPTDALVKTKVKLNDLFK